MHPQGGEHLKGVRHPAAVVLVRVQEERRRRDAVGIFERGLGHIFSRPFPGLPPTWSWAKYQPMSELLWKLVQFEMLRWLAAHLKRSVWPIIQLVMKPP